MKNICLRRKKLLLALSLFSLSALISTNTNAQFVTGQSADLVLGQPDFATATSGISASKFYNPYGIAIHPITGKTYISDGANNRVARFSSVLASGMDAEAVLGQTDLVSSASGLSSSQMNFSSGSAFDSQGNLWVADFYNYRVLMFRNADSLVNGASADLVLGQPDFNTNTLNAPANNNFDSGLEGVHVDSTGRLWVADYGNGRILWFDNASDLANGANASGVLGKPDFNSTSNGVTASLMAGPGGMFVDKDDHLWVADYSNNRVLRFDNASTLTSGASASAVLGQADFTSNTAGPSQTLMRGPNRLTVDSMGTLWVVEYSGHRVLGYYNAASKANGAPADVVLGQPDFDTGNSGSGDANLFNPVEVTVDFQGRLLVADYYNNRVVRYGHPAAQPDTSVRYRKKQKGVGVFDNPKMQTLRVPLNNKRKAEVAFEFKNSNTLNPDAFLISGPEFSKPAFDVKYFHNEIDVTAEIIAGTFILKNINPGTTETIVAKINTKKVRPIKGKEIKLSSYSTISSVLTDSATAVLFRLKKKF